MAQYIDKSAVVAEIKKRLSLLENGTGDSEVMKRVEGVIKGYKSILSFLDTLETKDVNFERELGKYVSDGIHRFYPNEGDDYYNMDSVVWQNYVIETAEHFYELGLKAQKGG